MIYETHNPEEIKRFITPDLFDAISEDGIEYESFEPNLRLGYLLQKTDDFEGMWIMERRNGITYCIHPAIPKEHRGKKAYKAAKEFYKYILDNIDFEKLIAETPVTHRHIKLFALRNGLKVEGTLRKSFKKYGEIHDQWILGITRKEIEAIL